MLKYLPAITPRAVSRMTLNLLRKGSCDAFERSLATAHQRQHEWILNRVRKCENTQFGRDHGFASIRTIEDFRAQVPIVSYEAFAPYINEVAAGNTAALIPETERLVQFTITTGSSGVPKLNPVTDTWLTQYRRAWDVWGMKFFVDHPQHIGARMLQMSGTWDMGRTPGGHQISMVSALLSKIQNPFLKPYYLIPNIVNEIPDPVVRHYVALRLSICADVGWILLMNPGTLIRLAEIGDTNADTLLKDVADGTLSEKFAVPDAIRRELVSHHLKPRPADARRLTQLASQRGRLLPKDYWKQPAISCWLGGTAGYQSRYLQDYFGPSPCRDMGLVSSEGRHTVPLQDTDPWGVPSIESGFYEFIPLEQGGADQPEAVDGRDLQVDAEYRLVMSTAAGYYRFDIGDVVTCRGFQGEAPQIEFLQKSARVGDLEGEKLTEHQVVEGAHKAAAASGTELSLITAIPRRLQNEQPRYDFVVEVTDIPQATADAFLAALDRELAKLNFLWRARRKEGVLQAPQLHLIGPGEWDRCIQAEVDRRGTGDYQYKHPGLVVDENWLEQFRIVSTVEASGRLS